MMKLTGWIRKRTIAIGMIAALTASLFHAWPFAPSPVAEAAVVFPSDTGLAVKFSPPDFVVTTQNPPDFRWPAVTGADSYDVQVSRSASMTTIDYEITLLNVNYYNFPQQFNYGTWYWRVKYRTSAGVSSDWSAIRKFRIEEQNVPFVVPSVQQLMSQVGTEHPRVWAKKDSLAAFCRLSQTSGKEFYDAKLASVNANLPKTPPQEPTLGQSNLKDYTYHAVDEMLDMAFIYLISQNAVVGNKAVQRLVSIANWKTGDNDPTGYTTNDQVHRYIAYKSAMAYDWLYDVLGADKATVKNMIQTRATTMRSHLSTIPSMPFDSHGWTAFGYLGIIATAMLNDIPEAASWFNFVVPAYTNMMPPWGGENGGWGQGTGYWQWSSLFGKEFVDVLLSATGFNLYKKAHSRNEGLYPLYAFPKGSPNGIFGDGSQDAPGGPSVTAYTRLAQMNGDPRLKWAAQAVGTGMYPDLNNYFYGDSNLTVRPPMDLPDSKWFPDIGLVAMHSKLYDPDAVSFYFRSSPYGSYNHSQADQNSFVINAFGEPLAIESGYYDDYGTPHDMNFSKQTFSSNAITIDGKYGQKINDMDAKGKVVSFVTHPDFDAVSGDATDAYNRNVNVLSKAGRSVIYVRPNMFVVIDQLQSANTGGNEFAWRLHAEDELQLDQDKAGATILKGGAGLKVRFYTPQNLRTEYEDRFLAFDGTEVLPNKVYGDGQQKHAAFIAPKTDKATFVTTLEAYKRDSAPQNVVSENKGDHMKLTFADGTIVYIRLTAGGEINADSVRFDGTAVAFKGDTVLLVDGTKVVKKGLSDVTLIASDQPSTIVYGRDRLSVSSPLKSQVALFTSNTVNSLRDSISGASIPSGGLVTQGLENRGVHWVMSGSTLTVNVEKGQRDFKLNSAPQPQPLPSVTLQTVVDGVPGSVMLNAYSDTTGASVAWGKLTNSAGLYSVEQAPTGLLFDQHGRSRNVYLEANAAVILQGATSPLTLKKIGPGTPTSTVSWSNPDQMRSNLYLTWQEAESYVASGGRNLEKISQSFLSGGTGLGSWYESGQWAKWTINVPRAGKYDLVLKYTADWDQPAGTITGRLAMVGDQAYYIGAPKTSGTGDNAIDWQGLRVKTGQQLAAGPVDITMWHASGKMKLDWIGLIEAKTDEARPSAPTNLQQVLPQEETKATVSWTPSTDNAGMKGYDLYVNGMQNKFVQNSSTTGTISTDITGLTPGKTYSVKVVAVDTSDNRSLDSGSGAISILTIDSHAPSWGTSLWLRSDRLFPDTARLTWSPATDNSGTVAAYSIYRKAGTSSFEKVGTVAGHMSAFDVNGLQSGITYTFQVQAADAKGNESGDGPVMQVKMPAAVSGGEFYESFDNLTAGTVPSGNWSVTTNNGASVTIEPSPDSGGKVLQVTDPSDSGATNDALVVRSNAGLSGKVTFETRFMFKKLTTAVGNFELKLSGSSKDVVRFVYFSDGTFGYYKDSSTNYKIPKIFSDFKLPLDQWVTLRFDLDTVTDTYDINMQADAFKGYTRSPEDTGSLNPTTGVYTVSGLKFYDGSDASAIDTFRFVSQKNTGKYLFDYVTMYPSRSDTTAPVWGGTAAVRPVHLFPSAARLEWDQATDNSGNVASYSIYRKDATQLTLMGTVAGDVYRYDVTGLLPGGTYTFQIKATDAQGNTSADGPSTAVTLPAADSSGAYYDSFDEWEIGNVSNGSNWEVATNSETSVSIVQTPHASSKTLLVTDNVNDTTTSSPMITRKNAALSGKVTFETRLMFKKNDTTTGNFELKLYGPVAEVVRFTYFSDGTLGYWINGTTNNKIPNSGFTLPLDQWVTLRFDLDTGTKKYDLTMQIDELKKFTGTPTSGSVNATSGVYSVSGLDFYNNSTESSIGTFRFTTQKYKSKFLFDYVAMYK
ncbi:DUF4962 domain-containing protein [Paenibacillus germinis]|nr:DUF4962 domain-containing protein [Paenibacillus germinis]